MKTNHFILFIFFFLNVVCFNCFAQLTDENTQIITTYFQSINSKSASSLSNSWNAGIQTTDNYIVLQQAGNNNEIEIKSNPNNSQTISQKGNDNYYNFINYYNSTSSNLNILQKGNSNSLNIYGENSLIKNMSIIQKSNNKIITIANF